MQYKKAFLKILRNAKFLKKHELKKRRMKQHSYTIKVTMTDYKLKLVYTPKKKSRSI